MPYKCVHCSKVFEDDSGYVLSGCDSCKSKFFFYIKQEQLDKINDSKDVETELEPEEKIQIEEDIRQIAGIDDEDAPVFLDFESIKIIKPGKYLIDIANLLSMKKPRVYEIGDGKYVIDWSSKGK